ncbi:Transcription antitermination factor NusB [Candidatus Cyrtobacter comes]|uniref:Transcription antitermination factor NusB n=1 Tax=Candidatus Cyrtobacter comes TaxID=675776 RepID=A0ABU5L6F7_9RICK|nr:transcription antitermination factor NusB [Candidatus Cyrtobacter comes]MDZ5761701.1 Transcription antitermination factor NusB [Candidatus Cyrtobacter comes]
MDRATRFAAIQYLYHVMVTHETVTIDSTTAFMKRCENMRGTPEDVNKLVYGVIEKSHIIEPCIERHLSPNWRFERLGMVLKAILKLSSFEIIFLKSTDKALIINQYLEIAKAFNHKGEVGFLNYIMDNVSL